MDDDLYGRKGSPGGEKEKSDSEGGGSQGQEYNQEVQIPVSKKTKKNYGDTEIKSIDTWQKYSEDHFFCSVSYSGIGQEEPAFKENKAFNNKVSLWEGDITKLKADAIVNAANESLLGGGGVDGCIHRAAGPKLLRKCRKLDGCKTGEAKITKGYDLSAKYVIHTVGPTWKNEEKLKNCYENCLKLALENKIKTLAFCCISTGIYGYPNRDAAEVALRTTREWLESNADKIERIIFCLFLDKDVKIYHSLMMKYFPPGKLKREGNEPGEKSSPEKGEVPSKLKEFNEKDNIVKSNEGKDREKKNVRKHEPVTDDIKAKDLPEKTGEGEKQTSVKGKDEDDRSGTNPLEDSEEEGSKSKSQEIQNKEREKSSDKCDHKEKESSEFQEEKGQDKQVDDEVRTSEAKKCKGEDRNVTEMENKPEGDKDVEMTKDENHAKQEQQTNEGNVPQGEEQMELDHQQEQNVGGEME